jgi:hypothetical protein
LHAQRKHDVILIAYDGSSEARSATEHAGELLTGEPTTVLTAWSRS